jgi:hypothetical protein
MPIEIRELVIKATVSSTESGTNSPATSDSETNASREEKIVARCVEQVMDILRIQKER